MAGPIYKAFMGRPTEAWYALSEEAQRETHEQSGSGGGGRHHPGKYNAPNAPLSTNRKYSRPTIFAPTPSSPCLPVSPLPVSRSSPTEKCAPTPPTGWQSGPRPHLGIRGPWPPPPRYGGSQNRAGSALRQRAGRRTGPRASPRSRPDSRPASRAAGYTLPRR